MIVTTCGAFLIFKIVYFIWTNVSCGGIFLDLGGQIVNFMWTKIESQTFSVEFVYNYEVSKLSTIIDCFLLSYFSFTNCVVFF